MNRKMIASVVAVLICISMIAAGYSMWIVIETAEAEIVDQVTVQTDVKTNGLSIAAKVVSEGTVPVEGGDGETALAGTVEQGANGT